MLRRQFGGYLVAILSVLLATGVRYAIEPWVGVQLPFLTFFFAVMISAWVGGLGPGLLSAGLSAMAANYFFVPPYRQVVLTSEDFVPITVFMLGAVGFTIFSERWKRREAALQEAAARVFTSEQRLRAMLGQASVGIALVDRTGLFLEVNDRLCAILGRPREELVQLTCQDVSHRDEWTLHSQLLSAVLCGARSSFEVETRYSRPDGAEVWVQVGVSPIRDEHGQVVQLVVVVADITDRRRAEMALRESEGRFAGFMKHLPGLAWIKDAAGRYVFANEKALHAFGRPAQDLYGRRDDEIFPRETAEQFARNDQAVISSGLPIEVVETLDQDDGCHYSLVSKFPIRVPGVEGVMTGGIAIDVTERKRAEDAVRDSEVRLRLALDGARLGMWSTDVSTGITDCTPLTKELFGLPPDVPTPTQEQWVSLIHPDDRDRVFDAWRRCVAAVGPYDVEYRVLWPDGTVRWLHTLGTFRGDELGAPLRMIGITMDITARKEAEEALRTSEEQFRSVYHQAIAGIAETDLSGRFVRVNQRYADMVGRTREELLRLRMQDITHPDDLPRNLSLFLPMVEGRGDAFMIEKRYVRPDGTVIWVSNSVSLLRDAYGNPRAAVAVCIDITARKQSEQALQRSEERYRHLYESMEEGFCVVEVVFDRQHRPVDALIVEHNQAFERQIGIRHSRGRRFKDLIPQHEQHWFDLYGRIVLTGESKRFQIPSGDRWYEGYAYPLGEAWDRKVAVILNDVTDRKAAEAKARQVTVDLEARVAERTGALVQTHEQLRALATELNLAEHRERKRLATELHDHLAQLLVLAKLKLSQVKQTAGLAPSVTDLLDGMETALTDSLTYTRTLVTDLSPPVLHEFGLEAALRWLAERMQNHELQVTLLVEEARKLDLPEDQAVLLFQSVRELLLNVVKHGQTGQAWIQLEHDGSQLRIQVIDHGAGFEPSHKAPHGEAGWATKFGLLSIRERMKALEGAFDVASSPGKGTTATLTLPLKRRCADPQVEPDGGRHPKIDSAPPPVTAASLPARSCHAPVRVLLVDDHAMVRHGLRLVLDSYSDIEVVGEASDGLEAVQETDRLRPVVVVMDINMPRMNGIDATAKIKTRYPHIVVIGLSVNAAGDNQDAMKTAGAALLLTKEAAAEHLHDAIQTAMKAVV